MKKHKYTKKTPQQQEALNQLREAGFAIIVWDPVELQGLHPQTMWDSSTEFGWDLIQGMGGEFIDSTLEEEDEEGQPIARHHQ